MPENPVTDPITDQEMASAHAALRKQVLKRLWEIAYMAPEMTRNSVTGQVKAIAMIIAIEGLIPDRRAGSNKNSASPAGKANIFTPQWRLEQKRKDAGLDPDPDLARNEDASAGPGPSPAADLPSDPNPDADDSQSLSARPSETTPAAPQPPAIAPASNMRVPYVPQTNPFARGRY